MSATITHVTASASALGWRANWTLIQKLIAKDWKLFEKQMAAYVLGGLFALALIGMAKAWSFYLGSLLLIVIMVGMACAVIANSILYERKERTLPFVMSLPITPLDYFLSKMLSNLLMFAVPMSVLVAVTAVVILQTPLPDGLFVYSLLLFGHVTLAFCVSLSCALAMESEGWNIFAMIGSMLMLNPFMMLLTQVPAIAGSIKVDSVQWSGEALSILGAQALLSVSVAVVTGWYHCRKRSFY
jgi:ABC-2 type transport system permease protein